MNPQLRRVLLVKDRWLRGKFPGVEILSRYNEFWF
jgi:hypothetical protein